MPRLIAKLISEDSQAELDAAIAVYKAAGGSELLTKSRAMASAEYEETDGDLRTALVLFHDGTALPASGAKTADLQHVVVREAGSNVELQAAIDDALAGAVHHEAVVADAVTSVAGVLSSAAGTPFVAGDVGRKVRIGAEIRTITVFNGTNNVDYDNSVDEGGDFTSGTGLTLDLLGAESLQEVHMNLKKSKSGGGHQLHMVLAVEGEAY